MKLAVAANYDPAIISKLADYSVEEVFGKLPEDIVGGGRPSYMATPITFKKLEKYVRLLEQNKISFNYLLNSACLANREWTRKWQKGLNNFLDRLGEIGVKRLTVSTPFLLEIIKTRFPEFFVKIGIFAQVDTVTRAKFWEELGADAITLESFSINRDFERLISIRNAVKCDLQLIANHCCLPNCALQNYHQNGISHSSDGSQTPFVDYCFLRCSRMRLQDPSFLIKANWIRPEDLHYYEEIGYMNFKILERGIPSSEILKRVKAYSQRHFEGNLAELIFYYGFKEPLKKQRFWVFRNFFRPLDFNISQARKFLDVIKKQGMAFPISRNPFVIYSDRIPANFLDEFKKRDCAMSDCDECGYCTRIAKQVVTVNDEFRSEFLSKYAQIETSMKKGALWDV